MERQKSITSGRFIIILFTALFFFAANTARAELELTAEEKDFLSAHAPIRIGIMNNWPPLNYTDAKGRPAGIGFAYFNAINKQLDGALTVEPSPFEESYKKVKSRELDALMDITPKKDREPYFWFTKPYLTIPHVIVGRKDGPYYSSENDLQGRTVALEKGYHNIIHFRQNHPKVKIREYGSTGDALDAVARGEADAYAGNRAVAIYLIEKELIRNLRLQGRLGIPPSELTIGVRKDRPILAAILNKALQDISEREREAINAHYISSRYEPWFASKQFWAVISISVAVAVLIGLASLIWNMSLKKMVEMRTRELRKEIDERKRAEQASQEREEQYAALFSGALDGVCLAEAESGILIDCNQALLDLVGREKAELIGQHQRILHPPTADQAAFSPTFAQHLKEKRGRVLETRIITKAGETKEVEISANLLNLHGKKILQGVFRDISERKRAEEELKRKLEELEIFYRAAIGREDKILELKRKVEELEKHGRNIG